MNDIHQREVQNLHRELTDLLKKVESAFPVDDQGEPDYVAHRLYHKKQKLDDEEFHQTKTKIIRDIATWLSIGAVSIILALLAKTFLLPSGLASLVK